MSVAVNGHARLPVQNGRNGAAEVPPQAQPAAASGRDAKGRFAPGNKGGPGNGHARRQCELRKALLSCVTAEDMARLGRVLLTNACHGDAASAKLLLAYALGQPGAAPSPDRLDLDELKQLLEAPDWREVQGRAGNRLPPDFAARLLRAYEADSAAMFVESLARSPARLAELRELLTPSDARPS
jgi:hypothetical protein